MTVQTHTRNASLQDLAALLKDQHARKVDLVVPAAKVRSEDGVLVVKGADAILTDEGVTQADGRYRPTAVCDEGVAEKLSIPLAYVRRLRDERPDLYDANVNGWLHGRREKRAIGALVPGTFNREPGELLREAIPGDGRSFMLRAFKPDDGEQEGIARALLSDRYNTIDNLDVLTAALDGVRKAGVKVEIDGCDLSERRMYVRIIAPEVQALAPDLLRGYRSPFSGMTGEENPVMFAGFQIQNSEVGAGSFTIVPRLVVQVCNNGMTITKDALRKVHLGSRLEEGVIRWSDETQSKNLDLVTAQAADAVRTFLDVDYMRAKIAEMTEKAGVRLEKPADDVKTIGKRLKFDESTIDGVLGHFIEAGQTTAGGLMQAVTSFAQTLTDADAAAELEASALQALEYAAAIR